MADTRLGAGQRVEAYSWPIPALTVAELSRLRVGGPGWLLVGDAAGLVDPITREGIFFALQSAAFAADAIAGAATTPSRPRDEDPACAAYARLVQTHIVPELMLAARLKAGFFQPRFARLVVDALQQSEGIRRVMADLVSGGQPYATLRWRLLTTFELRLAWRMLSGRWRDNRRARVPAPSAG